MSTNDLAEAIIALRTSFALDSRDWSATATDAWRYGVIVGWSNDSDNPDDGDALAEIATRHPGIDIDRMVRLHAALDAAATTTPRRPAIDRIIGVPTTPARRLTYTHHIIPDATSPHSQLAAFDLPGNVKPIIHRHAEVTIERSQATWHTLARAAAVATTAARITGAHTRPVEWTIRHDCLYCHGYGNTSGSDVMDEYEDGYELPPEPCIWCDGTGTHPDDLGEPEHVTIRADWWASK